MSTSRWLDGPAGALLSPFGAAFSAVTRLRGYGYARGWLRSHRPPMPTLSIGNHSVGGTGKTPLLFDTLRRLEDHEVKAGVLSRGYGGDEGRMLEERHPEVLLAEDPDRVRALQQFLVQGPPEVLVLDDGFQHYRLERDLDVVMLDATRPFGRCLPAGMFREPGSSLRRADLVVLSRTGLVEPSMRDAIWRRIHQLREGLPTLPRIEGDVAVRDVRNLRTDESLPVRALSGMDALVAAGVGNPDSFVRLVQGHGANVRDTHFPGDHHAWTEDDIQGWKSHPHVLVTEKDAVKLRSTVDDRVWEVRVDWRFDTGESEWDAALERLILPIRAATIEPLWAAHDPDGTAASDS